jgi:hypothetical protein
MVEDYFNQRQNNVLFSLINKKKYALIFMTVKGPYDSSNDVRTVPAALVKYNAYESFNAKLMRNISILITPRRRMRKELVPLYNSYHQRGNNFLVTFIRKYDLYNTVFYFIFNTFMFIIMYSITQTMWMFTGQTS